MNRAATNRVETRMAQLQAEGKHGLALVIMLGDPTFEKTFQLVDAAVEAGADVIELGIPSSDPFLDSPSMQSSMQRAGQHFKDSYAPYLAAIREIRQRHPDQPIEIMFYQDVIEGMGGMENFARQIADAGADAALMAEISNKPPEFRRQLGQVLSAEGIIPIRFVPDPFQPHQAAGFVEGARGFVVVQTCTDAVGRRDTVWAENRKTLDAVRALDVQVPLMVAYGIKTDEHVRACIQAGADGVLIGSVLLDAAIQLSIEEYTAMLRGFRQAANS